MSPQSNDIFNTIYNAALKQSPQPISIINGPIDSKEQLFGLLMTALDSKNPKGYVGTVVNYRTIEKLFPSQDLSPHDFRLSIPDHDELKKWALGNGFEVKYLLGTDGISLRPFHFTLLSR